MPSTLLFIALSIYAISAISAASSSLLDLSNTDGKVRPNSYIIKIKDGIEKEACISTIGPNSSVTQNYEAEFFNGFAGVFDGNDLASLQANPDIEWIDEDNIMTTSVKVSQINAPWGLGRLSSATKLTNQNPFSQTFNYTYDDRAGNGVDVYLIDTGIYAAHPDFSGRAQVGPVFGPYQPVDGNGHGTHVAGIAGSTTYGVAKRVNLIGIKVLSDSGSGSSSDIIAGLGYVRKQRMTNGRPSIASMSLGGSASTSLDSAVASLINSGVHVVVAAGNSNVDAKNTSPARVAAAITVGATDITDSRAYYSNFGSVVDIFAPGSNITSTWNDGGSHVLSGTSMATPQVAGLVAYIISISGNRTPAAMSTYIKSIALKNMLQNITPPTSNYLANNIAA